MLSAQQAAPPAAASSNSMREHFPDPVFDKSAPALPAGLKAGGILIFSKTNGFRDTPAIQASNAALPIAPAIVRIEDRRSPITENSMAWGLETSEQSGEASH
jgi:hypothetical protein